MKKIFSICIAALLGLSSWSMTTKAQQTAINIGQPVPNIMLPTKKGVVSGLDALQGKYVYLVFWASTCPNSQKEIGNWRALHQRYHSTSFADANGFEVYSVSMDENSAAWQNVAKANPWTNDCYDVQGFSSAVAQRFDIFALPSNLIIDPRGLVIGKDLSMDEVDALLKGRETATPSLQQSLIQQSANTAAKNIWEQGDLEKMSNVTGIPSFNPSGPVAPARNFAPIPPTSALSNVVKNNGNKNRPYNNGGETKTQTIFLPPVYTKIQVGAFSTLAFHRLNHLNDLGLIEQETTANGLTRVLIGTFTNQHTIDYVLKEAKKRGYKDAYTVQYFDGQRINSDTQLTKLIAQKRQQMETERLAARQVESQLQPKRSMTTTQSPNAVATYPQPKQATGGTFYDTYNNNANSSTATVNGFDRSKAGNTTPNRNTGGVGAFKPGETKAVNSVNANAVYYQTPKQTKNSTGIKPISTPNKSTGVRMYQPPTKNNTNTLNNTPSQNKRNGNTMYYQAPKQTTKPSSNSPKNTDASTNTPSRNGIDVNTIYDKPNTPTSKNEASLGSVQTKTTPSKAAEMTISPSKPITNNTSATPTIKAPIKPTKSDVNKTVETKPVEQNATKPSPNTKSTLVTKTKIPVGNAYTQKSNRTTTAKEVAISAGKTDVKIPVGNAYTQKSNRKTTDKETTISAGKTDVKIPTNGYTKKVSQQEEKTSPQKNKTKIAQTDTEKDPVEGVDYSRLPKMNAYTKKISKTQKGDAQQAYRDYTPLNDDEYTKKMKASAAQKQAAGQLAKESQTQGGVAAVVVGYGANKAASKATPNKAGSGGQKDTKTSYTYNDYQARRKQIQSVDYGNLPKPDYNAQVAPNASISETTPARSATPYGDSRFYEEVYSTDRKINKLKTKRRKLKRKQERMQKRIRNINESIRIRNMYE